MPKITIVNTSPLFYLHRLGLLELLNELYGHITVPAGVLLRAKQQGFVTALKPVIEKLLDLDFRLKPDLITAILELSGEA